MIAWCIGMGYLSFHVEIQSRPSSDINRTSIKTKNHPETCGPPVKRLKVNLVKRPQSDRGRVRSTERTYPRNARSFSALTLSTLSN